jgi:hypothetical protein
VRTLTGIYKAVCLGVDNQGEVIRCQVPQIFNDETVTCFDIAGGVFPVEGDEGWVVFESGYPDHPIWLAASEGISSPDVTPGVGVIDVGAGAGIVVTPGQHPVVSNTGVLDVSAGAGISVTLGQHPVVANTGVVAVVAGTNVTVDSTNPTRPIVSAAGGGGSGGTDEVWVGPDPPTGAQELWYDTDAVATSTPPPFIVKQTAPVAADFGTATIPLDAVWIKKP